MIYRIRDADAVMYMMLGTCDCNESALAEPDPFSRREYTFDVGCELNILDKLSSVQHQLTSFAWYDTSSESIKLPSLKELYLYEYQLELREETRREATHPFGCILPAPALPQSPCRQ